MEPITLLARAAHQLLREYLALVTIAQPITALLSSVMVDTTSVLRSTSPVAPVAIAQVVIMALREL